MTGYQLDAAVRWPEAKYCRGDGRWATLRDCYGLTVELHATEQAARSALARIHPGAVNSRVCRGLEHHHLVDLDE